MSRAWTVKAQCHLYGDGNATEIKIIEITESTRDFSRLKGELVRVFPKLYDEELHIAVQGNQGPFSWPASDESSWQHTFDAIRKTGYDGVYIHIKRVSSSKPTIKTLHQIVGELQKSNELQKHTTEVLERICKHQESTAELVLQGTEILQKHWQLWQQEQQKKWCIWLDEQHQQWQQWHEDLLMKSKSCDSAKSSYEANSTERQDRQDRHENNNARVNKNMEQTQALTRNESVMVQYNANQLQRETAAELHDSVNVLAGVAETLRSVTEKTSSPATDVFQYLSSCIFPNHGALKSNSAAPEPIEDEYWSELPKAGPSETIAYLLEAVEVITDTPNVSGLEIPLHYPNTPGEAINENVEKKVVVVFTKENPIEEITDANPSLDFPYF